MDVDSYVQLVDMEEARYLISKLIGMTLNQAALAAQREANNKDIQNEMKQVAERDAVHQQLLQHVLANSDLEVYNLVSAGTGVVPAADEPLPSGQSSRSVSPVESIMSSSQTSSRYSRNLSRKARRLTFAAPEELLYYAPSNEPSSLLTLGSSGPTSMQTIFDSGDDGLLSRSPK